RACTARVRGRSSGPMHSTRLEPPAEEDRAAAPPRSERRPHPGTARLTQRRDDRLRSLRDALRAASQGDFSLRLPTDGGDDALFGEVALAYNAWAEQSGALVHELHRVSSAVEHEGDMTARASLGPAGASWAVAVGSVNALIQSMAHAATETTRILG